MQKLELWIPQQKQLSYSCLEILDTAGAYSNYALKGFCFDGDFSFLNLMLSSLSKIIVDIFTSCSLLPDLN